MIKLQTVYYNEHNILSKRYMEDYDRLKDSKSIIVFTHNDMDGLSAGELVREKYNVSIDDIYTCNYSSSIPDLALMLDKDVVFTDYCLRENALTELLQANTFKSLTILDHHDTSLKLVPILMKYIKNGNHNIYFNINTQKCGTMIAYEELNKDPKLKRFVTLVDDYDRWVGDYAESKYLNAYFFESGANNLRSGIYAKAMSSEEELNRAIEVGKKLFMNDLERYKILNDNFSFKATLSGYKIKVIEGHGNSMMFDNIKDYDAVCVFHRLGADTVYSLYTVYPDRVKIKEIAENYGGGGHPGACGFTIRNGEIDFDAAN